MAGRVVGLRPTLNRDALSGRRIFTSWQAKRLATSVAVVFFVFTSAAFAETVEEQAAGLLARLRDETAWKPLAEKWESQKFDGEPIVNFAFPAEHYDDGRIKAVLRAKNAVLSSDDSIWAWGVTVVMYDRAGEQEGEMEAETCLFDRKTQTGYSAGRVNAQLKQTTVSGENCFWSLKDSFFRMLFKAEIHTAGNPLKTEVVK